MRIFILTMSLLYSLSALAQPGVVTLESRVTGNQEQPNVISIVPWKDADDRQRIDQGLEADINDLFQHLDEAEFVRQQQFYQHFQAMHEVSPTADETGDSQ